MLTSTFGHAAAGHHTPRRGHNLLDGGAPHYGVYETADGRYITLAPLEPAFFAAALDALGLEHSWLERRRDPATWPELRRLIADAVRTRTQDEWRTALEGGDSCFAPVLPLEETQAYPHFAQRGSVVVRDGVAQPAATPRFDRTPAPPVASVHPAGTDTDAVLAGLGHDTACIQRLRQAGAVA